MKNRKHVYPMLLAAMGVAEGIGAKYIDAYPSSARSYYGSPIYFPKKRTWSKQRRDAQKNKHRRR